MSHASSQRQGAGATALAADCPLPRANETREAAANVPQVVRPARVAHPWLLGALLLAPLLVLIATRSYFFPTDPDYWWHARTGQLIVETGALPREDVFSYTRAGTPWVTHEWLTQVIFFLVERHVGYVGTVTIFALLVVATALLVYQTCRLRGLGEPAAAILMLAAWASWTSLSGVRPQVVSAVFLAGFAYLLTRYKQGHPRALYPLPVLMALWVNLHGGYIIGLALLGLAIVGEVLARLIEQPAAPARPLMVVTLLTGLATLISPHGLEALAYPFSYAASSTASMRFVSEWQSPSFHQTHFLSFAAVLFALLLLGLGRRPLGPTEVLWGVLFTLLALRSLRHIPLYAIVVVPLLAARLQAELPALRLGLQSWQRRRLLIAGAWIAATLTLLSFLRMPEWQVHRQLGSTPNAIGYPSGAVAYLQQHSLPGKLFNSYDWGGYLIRQLYPERRVFIDGRADVYGDALIEQYVATVLIAPGWQRLLDEHDVDLVLVPRESALAVVLGERQDWREVYAGEVERLFVRQRS